MPSGSGPIEVGSPEWDILTERRAELIYKKNRDGLTESEWSEYNELQRKSREAIAIQDCDTVGLANEIVRCAESAAN